MYGCSDPVLVYGFNTGNRDAIINPDYLARVFPDISEYARDVVRNYLGEAIYGIECGLNMETGQAIISDDDKQKVKQLYDKYVEYVKTNFDLTCEEILKDCRLGFHLAVTGDYETCQDYCINLDDDWEEEEEEEDDDEEEDV